VAGLLAHKRGFLPLHANAVEIDGRIVAFMGESGAGKSTLAAWLNGHGFPLLADDVAVVDFDAGVPEVLPGLARLRLWDPVIEATGRNPVDFALSFEGDPSYRKRDVIVNTSAIAAEPRKLGLLVELGRDGPLFEPLHGARAAEAVIAHTYRGGFVKTLNSAQEHWAMCMRLIHAVPVYRANVDFDLNRLDDSYRPLLEQVKAVLAEQADGDS
jgi:energy-coupling factor transporter ATP-binding protein EcfA2